MSTPTSHTPTIGEHVPNFSFLDTSGKTQSLSDFKGQRLVLYFYPKDNTPGCTMESKGFRDFHNKFKSQNTVVFGISRDSIKAHDNFKAKCNMPFELISDGDSELCQLFDVIKQKSMFGKKYMGIERSTFVIDETGILKQEWRKVKVLGHVNVVFDYINSL